MLSSGGQGESKQDRFFAEVWIVKKVIAQECDTVRPVAYFGRGQMGKELVYADPQGMFFCSPGVLAITPKSYIDKV